MSYAYTISGHFSGRRTMATARYVLLLALAGLYLTPLVLALISSFKTPAELQQVLSFHRVSIRATTRKAGIASGKAFSTAS